MTRSTRSVSFRNNASLLEEKEEVIMMEEEEEIVEEEEEEEENGAAGGDNTTANDKDDDDDGDENANEEDNEEEDEEQEKTSDNRRHKQSATVAATTTNTTQQQQQQSSSSLMCPNCGSREIEQHDASGASVCIECGVVVEENAIVSAVEFVEGAGGASSMVGQFVSATSSKAYTGGSSSGGHHHGGHGHHGGSHGGHHHHHHRRGAYGFSKDSRETTLANGRRRIQDVASRLRLGSQYVDSAHRLFTVAVEKNFVQGRRTTHVVAACLYIACRQEQSQHMLIDFSDALQVNVYTLGTCFLKFRRLLGLKLEIIDPALYVYRFAAHLDLDDKANAVALTALRLVARMKRDWIVSGRRPAGICAAALLIAARAHGFSKHHQDVTRILRVCGLTVTTRVKEFEQTPSSALTLHQFHNVDLDTEADPPIYTKNKIREARAKAIQQNDIALLTSGALDDPLSGKQKKRWRDVDKQLSERQTELKKLYESIEQELSGQSQTQQQEQLLKLQAQEEQHRDDQNDGEAADTGKGDGESGENQDKEQSKDRTSAATTATSEESTATTKENNTNSGQDPTQEKQLVVHTGSQSQMTTGTGQVINSTWSKAYPKRGLGKAIILPEEATAEERLPSVAPVEAKINMEKWKQDMPTDMVEEIDSMFRTEEEITMKEAVFNRINKDYLEQQERKEQDRLSSEAATKDQEKVDAAQAEGHMRYNQSKAGRPSKRKKRGGEQAVAGKEGENAEPTTTEEALYAAVSNRKISRKINYEAMSSLFNDEGDFATDMPQESEMVDSMYGTL